MPRDDADFRAGYFATIATIWSAFFKGAIAGSRRDQLLRPHQLRLSALRRADEEAARR
jgi:hypothetical protein